MVWNPKDTTINVGFPSSSSSNNPPPLLSPPNHHHPRNFSTWLTRRNVGTGLLVFALLWLLRRDVETALSGLHSSDPRLSTAQGFSFADGNNTVSTSSTFANSSSSALEPEWEWARDVSLVYTWVNGSEPEYIATRQAWSDRLGQNDRPVRYRDNGDLLYSFRTVAGNMPWHRGKVFLVSPSPPTWLNLSHPRVTWIDQDTLIPKDIQPTYNTNAIEPFLHLIPGIGDLFIHLNDDYMILNPVHPSMFFTQAGGTRFFLEHRKVYPQDILPNGQAPGKWLASVYNSVKVLQSAYGNLSEIEPPRFLHHAPFVYHRQAFLNFHQRFHQSIRQTVVSKFRAKTDVLTPLMHHNYVIQEGSRCCGMKYEVVSQDEINRIIHYIEWSEEQPRNQARLAAMLLNNPIFFNVNDNMSPTATDTPAQKQLLKAFEDLFGHFRSPFEKMTVDLKSLSSTDEAL